MSNGLARTNQNAVYAVCLFSFLNSKKISLVVFFNSKAIPSKSLVLLDLTTHLHDDIVKKSRKTTRRLHQKGPV